MIDIERASISPINRSIEFASKFPDIITDKTQLQRFLGSLNYVAPFIKDLAKDTAIPFVPWFMCKHVHNYISMLERDFTLSNGEITRYVFPPQQSFQINEIDRDNMVKPVQKASSDLDITESEMNHLLVEIF